ncbi:MAG: ATP-binding protein [Verrucomicrobiota bacterium]
MKTDHTFLREAGRIVNSGQSRSLILHGNVHDLFAIEEKADRDEVVYTDLGSLLAARWGLAGNIIIRYELNGLIQIPEANREDVGKAWDALRGGVDRDEAAIREMLGKKVKKPVTPSLEDRILKAVGDSLQALEILRQITLCSRRGLIESRVIIVIDNADVILPEGPLANLSEKDRSRVCKVQDWFSEPSFASGEDTVVLVAEAESLINHRVSRLPQVLSVEIESPDFEARKEFIQWFNGTLPETQKLKRGMSQTAIAELSAGLSLYALQQLLKGAAYRNESLRPEDVVAKVEAFIIDQIGEDIVEFKKPDHGLRDVVGFSRLKSYLKDEFIPRIRSTDSSALTGAAVAGPIGSGKTFVFEAVAGELGIVVMTIKNIRSQWFGQTDVLFEKLKRVLQAVGRALIFIDEADTQFGGVGKGDHSTERRLTGKIQALMSDQTMKGKVTWLLITARIHLLSPDIRRPGRAGSLIIPVLDPKGQDHEDFLRWSLKGVLKKKLGEHELERLRTKTEAYSAAQFANLRSELRSLGAALDLEEVERLIDDLIPPDIADTRRYQTLQALVNCTRKSLLDDPEAFSDSLRKEWRDEIAFLESIGIE